MVAVRDGKDHFPARVRANRGKIVEKSPVSPNMTSVQDNVKRGLEADTAGSRRMSFGKKMREGITGKVKR